MSEPDRELLARFERVLDRLEAVLGLAQGAPPADLGMPPRHPRNRRRLPIGARQRDALALLAIYPTLTAAEVQAHLGIGNGRAYALMRALEDRGLAGQVQDAKPAAWQITDTGREQA